MTRTPLSLTLVLAAVAFATLPAAHAVNLLSNGSFTTDTSSWAAEDPPNATLAFSPIDANGAAGSGSALIANVHPGPGQGEGITQCVNTVAAGRTYRFGGKVLFPTGQNRTGFVAVGLRWWSGANCTGNAIDQPRVNRNTPGDAWIALASAPQIAPAGTVSAEFVAFPSKVEAGGQLVAQFDDLFLDDGLVTANYSGIYWTYPAASENGWGLIVSDDGTTLFVTWFTYGADGLPTWFVFAAGITAPNVYTGTVYTGTGPPYNASPWNPANVTPTAVGTAMLTFTDFNRAIFAYTIGNASQQKQIVRQIFNAPVPTCVWNAPPNFVTATNYQGTWWAFPAGSQSGWGLSVNHQDGVLFVAWFTYGTDGKATWFVVAASQTAPGIYIGKLFRATSGPPFFASPWNPALVVGTEVGSATFTFADGNTATFEYTVNGQTQLKPITREIFVPPGTVCN